MQCASFEREDFIAHHAIVLVAHEGHIVRGKAWRTHLDLDVTDLQVVAMQAHTMRPGIRLHDERRIGLGPATPHQIEHHAAKAIAAHLGPRTVGVEHFHPHHCVMLGYDQNAIATDAAMAITERLRCLAIDGLRALMDDEKVVAEAFVFLERDAVHALNLQRVRRRWQALKVEGTAQAVVAHARRRR